MQAPLFASFFLCEVYEPCLVDSMSCVLILVLLLTLLVPPALPQQNSFLGLGLMFACGSLHVLPSLAG